MVRWDGHEIGVLSTLAGCVAITHGCMPKGWAKSFIHRQPIAAITTDKIVGAAFSQGGLQEDIMAVS